MEHFWDTSDTIPEGFGFSHFDSFHLTWLGACAALCIVFALLYRRFSPKARSIWRKTVAVLLIADELFKLIPMIVLGNFHVKYLPLHLCSINIFIIAIHAWKPSKLLDNFLYTVCIPGALAALLFPTWTDQPALNYMLIHSFTVHILLLLYPVVLTVGGDIKPELKAVPKSLLLLVDFGIVALVFNLIFDTNFMFLMSADQGNPLYLFQQLWGSHLYGFPVLIAAVIVVMYAPLEIARGLKKKQKVQ